LANTARPANKSLLMERIVPPNIEARGISVSYCAPAINSCGRLGVSPYWQRGCVLCGHDKERPGP
jgi:hypothetical protein